MWPKIAEPAHHASDNASTKDQTKQQGNSNLRGQHKEDITNIMKSQAYIISCIQSISLGSCKAIICSSMNFTHLFETTKRKKQKNSGHSTFPPALT